MRPVVLSHDFWRRTFPGVGAGDPSALGRMIRLDDVPFTVVGVMPEDFAFPLQREPVDLWVSAAVDAEPSAYGGTIPTRRGYMRYDAAMARLKPGISVERAQAELNTLAAQLARAHPDGARTRKFGWCLGWSDGWDRCGRRCCCSSVPWPVCCASAASTSRTCCSRARHGAQAGGRGAARARKVPRLDEVRMDEVVLGFTLLLSLVTALGCGLVPALSGSGPGLGGRGTGLLPRPGHPTCRRTGLRCER